VPRSPTDTIRFLTLDELGRLLAATRGSVRDRALFLVAYRHGLRASEVGLLRAEDLDLRTLRLMVHRLKGSHSGAHPLPTAEQIKIGRVGEVFTAAEKASGGALVTSVTRRRS
jgi:integrase